MPELTATTFLQYGIAGLSLLVVMWFARESRNEREKRDLLFMGALKDITGEMKTDREKAEANATARNEKLVGAFSGIEKVIESLRFNNNQK